MQQQQTQYPRLRVEAKSQTEEDVGTPTCGAVDFAVVGLSWVDDCAYMGQTVHIYPVLIPLLALRPHLQNRTRLRTPLSDAEGDKRVFP